MTAQVSNFFHQGWLQALGSAANHDSFVAQHSALATFNMGFRNTETGENAWIAFDEGRVTAGTDTTTAIAFTFAGDTAAFNDLHRGFPFNRLVRQHRLVVEGDMRSCVQNWLLIYAVTRLAAGLEH
ncbi:hypothetical protein LKR43_05825 [Pusillimonas sp. MFBS29]|uniref:hypothetical protein n=1 Tax=Pusillimonas sp. MFBS29 TaxID=2886690 RepID=UPI001D11AEB1|nr:hypothetical protein [Pusillimonas sp. MFBS29]MCC2595855.1 hypothetical protein [Pusillimonas sp. MFBS29]